MRALWLCGVLAFCCAAEAGQTASPGLTVEVRPKTPLIETTEFGQALNFDFVVTNKTGKTMELGTVLLAVRDKQGRIARRVEINDNGISPGIATVANAKIADGATAMIFNPLHTMPRGVPLDRLEFELLFADPDGKYSEVDTVVEPVAYLGWTRLTLPLKGRILVWDGHDYYAHHRRLDMFHPAIKDFHWAANSSRYSLDLVVVDTDGRMHGASDAPASYFGYGHDVIAPADGVVVKAVNDVKEGAENDLAALGRDLTSVLGNQVVIDHGNGEFSHLGHLKPGSLLVHAGDHVRRGQVLAKVGTSGWSIFPHLHYELTRSADMMQEGLPATFHGFRRVLGSKAEVVRSGPIDSGDIVENGLR